MVYRGKPSAGCESCRKAKKRCTLEQPACARCVKLRRECIGYRDTSQLQIQDETQSILDKAERRRPTHWTSPTSTVGPLHWTPAPEPQSRSSWQVDNFNDVMGPNHPSKDEKTKSLTMLHHPGSIAHTDSNESDRSLSLVLTPTSANPESSSSKVNFEAYEAQQLKDYDARQFEAYKAQQPEAPPDTIELPISDQFVAQHHLQAATEAQAMASIPKALPPMPDDVAMNYFLSSCTVGGGRATAWAHFPHYNYYKSRDSCLDLAIKACGMAALDNVRSIPYGREWSRRMYTRALGLLNASLRDSTRSKMDQSLVAVTMLSFYENLVSDGVQSEQSWKAHIHGAAQLLRLRGKAQLKTLVGRQLFRELRGQVMINCLWDSLRPPDFLSEWQEELNAQSSTRMFVGVADDLTENCLHYARLRSKIRLNQLSDQEAMDQANECEARMVQWALDTARMPEWGWREMQVPVSPHVFNGMLHACASLPVPGVWNMYRSVRILISRTQEVVSRRFRFSDDERAAQHAYFRAVRRQMTDEICATLPCVLGHSAPAYSSPCVLITGYNAVWPCLFAAVCALERVGLNIWEQAGMTGEIAVPPSDGDADAGVAQASWLLSRLDYIARHVGLHWADGIAQRLRGAIRECAGELPAADRVLAGDGSNTEHVVSGPGRHIRDILRDEESYAQQIEAGG